MATRSRTRTSSMEETPIKHTAGGEMPDPSEQHHVKADELEALGGVEGEETASNFMNQTKSYLPVILGAIGIGVGVYFLAKKVNAGSFQGEFLDRFKDRFKNWRKEEGESDTADAEGKRALDIDDVQPSRLMGA